MKRIGSGSAEAQWNRRMVEQLSFIKQRLRYPINRHTAWPAFAIAGMFPALGFAVYLTMVSRHASQNDKRWFPLALIAMMLTPGITAVLRYLKTLKFVAVPALPAVAENIALLISFLKANHLAFSRHPEAPEVFQIISKNIGSGREDREVMFFIADEGRILVNSHFTSSRFRSAIGSPHYQQMARTLSAWINQSSSQTGLRTL